jgi:hypothetical protein
MDRGKIKGPAQAEKIEGLSALFPYLDLISLPGLRYAYIPGFSPQRHGDTKFHEVFFMMETQRAQSQVYRVKRHKENKGTMG